MIIRFFNVQSLLWLALVLALAGSLKHLAAVFASVDGGVSMGWLQAIAIDAGLFALSYSIRQRKTDKRTTKPIWTGVLLFSAISIYGNLAYGILSTSGNLPLWIVTIKPYILAGSLPILVLFLAELLSDDRQFSQAEADKEAKKQTKQRTNADEATTFTTESSAFVPGDMSQLDKANEVKQDKIDERRAQVLAMLSSGLDKDAIAESLNVSVKTVARDIIALNGKAGVR